MEGTEKIYCYDHDNSALMAALMNNRNNGFETAALMNGGMNGMWNNPMMYLVWLAVLGNGGFGFGGNRGMGCGNTELNGRFDAIQAQIDTNHNNDLAMSAIQGNHNAIHELAGILNTSFQNVSSGICDVRAAIKEVGGQVGFSAERVINAANVGDMNIITAIKDCCCDVERQNMQTNYNMATQNCATLQAIDKLGDRIIDYMANDKAQALRDENFSLKLASSQAMQNNYLLSRLQPTPVPAFNVPSPFVNYGQTCCGCNVG